jgi:hypothetical protein
MLVGKSEIIAQAAEVQRSIVKKQKKPIPLASPGEWVGMSCPHTVLAASRCAASAWVSR